MSDLYILEEQLAIGRKLMVNSTAPSEQVQMKASISSVDEHHFNVRTNAPIPPQLFTPQQPLTIHLFGSMSPLSLSCRFLCIDSKMPNEMVLSTPEGKWITNRRAFVRAHMAIPITVLRHTGQMLTGTTIDIGGGGALVKFSEILNINEIVEATLGPAEETGDESLRFKARVTRMVKIFDTGETDTQPICATALEFVDVATNTQNKVCKMVIVNQFEQNRQKRRKVINKE